MNNYTFEWSGGKVHYKDLKYSNGDMRERYRLARACRCGVCFNCEICAFHVRAISKDVLEKNAETFRRLSD